MMGEHARFTGIKGREVWEPVKPTRPLTKIIHRRQRTCPAGRPRQSGLAGLVHPCRWPRWWAYQAVADGTAQRESSSKPRGTVRLGDRVERVDGVSGWAASMADRRRRRLSARCSWCSTASRRAARAASAQVASRFVVRSSRRLPCTHRKMSPLSCDGRPPGAEPRARRRAREGIRSRTSPPSRPPAAPILQPERSSRRRVPARDRGAARSRSTG
jgi:hypothetical protein